jgi:hypothetical protein
MDECRVPPGRTLRVTLVTGAALLNPPIRVVIGDELLKFSKQAHSIT